MQIFDESKSFPEEERYSLTDQVRRSSRSVCANLAEACRKRRYEASFLSKLSDAEAEAAETQVWLELLFNVVISKKKPCENYWPLIMVSWVRLLV